MSRRKRTTLFPVMIAVGGVLILAAVLVWLNNPGAPAGSAQIPDQPAGNEVDQDSEIARVNLEEAKAAFDSGAAVFLDVRSTSSYTERHIAGALNIPLSELPERLEELRGADWIITYCT